MTPLRPLTVLALSALVAPGLAACGDEHVSTLSRDDFHLDWTDAPPVDPILAATLATPAGLEPALVTPRVCLPAGSTPTVVSVARADGTLLPTQADGFCLDVLRDARPIQPGDALAVTLEDFAGARRTFKVTVPEHQAPLAHQALSALRTADGTTWLATPHEGLLGLTADGRAMHYPGVLTVMPWDAAARGPQSGLVLALEPSGSGAMWLATAATGISWFDPGADPLDAKDDTWIHGQPMAAADPATTPKLAPELAQTAVAIAPDPRDPTGLWVATLNGVFHAHRGADTIAFTRVADGAALAIAVDAQGLVWVGFSTQAVFNLPAPDAANLGRDATVTLPPSAGALLVLDPGADPDAVGDDHLVWAMADEDAVTAVLPEPASEPGSQPGAGDGAATGSAWVGTPYGLARATFQAGQVTLAPAPAALALGDVAVTALAPSHDGFWIAARAECAVDAGRLLRVHADAAGDVASVADLGDAGFGERDFAFVRELASGDVLVSTLVPSLAPAFFPGLSDATARGCAVPPIATRTADLYTLTSEGGPATPFGAR